MKHSLREQGRDEPSEEVRSGDDDGEHPGPTARPRAATTADDDVAPVVEDLVEDVSIDGMCGVY